MWNRDKKAGKIGSSRERTLASAHFYEKQRARAASTKLTGIEERFRCRTIRGKAQFEPNAFSIFWSVLYWLNAYTAQIAAGTHPINVIWRIKQIMPAIGRPMVKNNNQGNNKAMIKRITKIS